MNRRPEATLKVAVLEDDVSLLSNVLIPGLTALGFDVEGFRVAKDFYRRLLAQSFDALVLDIDLPDEDGRHTARYLRVHRPEVALIALTGLRLPPAHESKPEVDAWLTKPIDIELLAVILSDLRKRKQAKDSAGSGAGRWRFDPSDWTLYAPDGRGLVLSLRERVVVEQLLAVPGRSVSREELVAALDEHGYELDSKGLDVLVHRLRRKVSEALDLPLPLHTTRGRGFVMLASVSALPDATAL
jgi:DNA-binding response OmpR family regulator